MDRSNFYPEGGGQVSDQGFIKFEHGQVFQVSNVQHIQDYSFHVGKFIENPMKQNIQVKDNARLEVDAQKRYDTTMNHTTVHLLNHALRYNTKIFAFFFRLEKELLEIGL